MGVKRNSLIALAALGTFLASGSLTASADIEAESAYFSKTLALALDLRPSRLISADDFSHLGKQEDTIILDTRSAEAFGREHIENAINLPLTEMTELSLALTLPSRTVRILIYSDQNFGDKTGPIAHDSSDLSLNLMSFLALTQYGYANVYELGERVERTDERLSWATRNTGPGLSEIHMARHAIDK